ncbi:endoplasmic reticulum membrane-associated RNA degradation protein-like isoform X1 [Phlebotomus papatasi]|uniref:endoplasmic reticulum membrane-associated RNA degradation protein-like isoform X1 n=1 Tax=Phlebotomus papatasi TaxID=29031 RepID=UPI002483B4D4|nr:endoplasmic reticulum membrane-associated RNA degradation protein-like isoform X1 [Phlebotomus papatasi]
MENQEESLISQEILDILLDPLYCDTGTTTTNRVEFILADFTLNWEKIAQLSEPKEFSYENCKDVISSHRKVWIEASCVFSQNFSNNIQKKIPKNLYYWTHRNDFLERILHEDFVNPSRSVEITLILSSVLEYALGNVFFTLSGKSPPHLLRDILVTEELQGIFRRNSLFFLQIILGTPNGINLRNLVWHGFPIAQEIPSYYPCILISVILSFGKMLNRVKIIPRKLSYNPIEMINKKINLDTSWCDLETEEILNFIRKSEFISSKHFIFWEEILQNYSTANYASGIIVLLPQFELVLRKIYGKLNNVDIRAKIGSYYVILDTFMDTVIPGTEESNKIHQILNPGILHLIHDLFVAPKGPRIRDKISHGELSLGEIHDKSLLNKLIALTLEVLSEFSERPFEKISGNLRGYKSQFHPNGSLLLGLKEIRKKQIEIYSIKVPENFQIDVNPKNSLPEIEFPLLKIFFRRPEEAEIVGILDKILQNALISSENVLKGLQERLFMFHAKTLRSKRRETLQKTLQLLPQIHSWLISLSEVVEKIFNLMQNSQEFWDCVPKDKLKKLLRKIQKYSENLTQSTQISSNDWIKSSSVMDKSVEMFAKVMQLVNF